MSLLLRRIWLPTLVALGCSDSTGPGLSDGDRLTLQIVSQLDWRTLPPDPATIIEAQVDGWMLRLTVRYSGGCRTHRFAVVAGTDFGESIPLVRQGGGDALRFELVELGERRSSVGELRLEL